LVAAQPGTDFDSKVKNVVVSVIKISAIVWNQAQREILPKASLGTPIQRIGAPEDIAAFVTYVASDSAGFVTGKVDPFL
jgi:NAD(P)-dependent dehydrogenase (short-subunit alcohol dehydrogenase family)